MFKNKKNEKTKNINNDKIKEQKNVLMDEGEKKERKIMKRIALVCALVAVVGGSFYGGMSYGRLLPASHRYYSNSQVYATVGDTDITGKDIKSVMEPIFYSNGLQKLTDSQISTYESTMLEYLVNIEVLYKEAKESNVEVTDDQVNENYETTISNINSQYNLSEEEYFKKFNLTEEKLKQRIKKELMGAKHLEEYSNVSEDEARNYFEKNKNDYKQIRASHILISNYDSNNKEVSDKKKAENKKTAEEVFAKGGVSADMPTSVIPDVVGMGVLDMLVKTGLLPSKGEARRLVQQNGLSINDVKYNDVNGVVTEDMITDEGMIIKKGKKTFHRVVTK